MFFKKMISLGVCFILLALFSGVIYSAEVFELDPLKVLNLALEHNYDVRIAQLELAKAKIDYEKNKAANILSESRYLELQNELSLAQAEDSYLQAKNDVIIKTLLDYLQIIQLKKDIAIKEKQLELEEKLLKETEAQVESGHLSSLDLLKQKNRRLNAEFSLNKARSDYEQLLDQFKINLGLDENLQLKMPDVFVFDLLEVKKEEAIKEALENSFTLKMNAERIKLIELDIEKAETKATPKLDLESLKIQLELAQLNYEKAKNSVKTSVENQYYKWIQANERLSLSEESHLLALENYEVTEKQKESGLKTENDLSSAYLSLMQEEYNVFTARVDVLINYFQLKNISGKDVEVIVDDLFIKE